MARGAGVLRHNFGRCRDTNSFLQGSRPERPHLWQAVRGSDPAEQNLVAATASHGYSDRDRSGFMRVALSHGRWYLAFLSPGTPPPTRNVGAKTRASRVDHPGARLPSGSLSPDLSARSGLTLRWV